MWFSLQFHFQSSRLYFWSSRVISCGVIPIWVPSTFALLSSPRLSCSSLPPSLPSEYYCLLCSNVFHLCLTAPPVSHSLRWPLVYLRTRLPLYHCQIIPFCSVSHVPCYFASLQCQSFPGARPLHLLQESVLSSPVIIPWACQLPASAPCFAFCLLNSFIQTLLCLSLLLSESKLNTKYLPRVILIMIKDNVYTSKPRKKNTS